MVGSVGEAVGWLMRLPGLPRMRCSPHSLRSPRMPSCIDGSLAMGCFGVIAAFDGRGWAGLLMVVRRITHMGSCNAWGWGWLVGWGWVVAA